MGKCVRLPGRKYRRCRRIGGFVLLLLLLSAFPADRGQADASDSALLKRVFPEATRIGAFAGKPAAAPAYRNDQVLGYVFHSRAVIASAGFSGKPLDVLIGIGKSVV